MEAKKKKKTELISMPQDILFDIFLRLPTPTLFQWLLVSKDWYNFIKNSAFTKLHKSQIQKDGPRFFLSTGYKNYLCLSDNKFQKSIRVDLKDISKEDIEVVGSSNGLLCLCLSRNRDLFYVCNPLTSEMIRICNPPHERTDGICRYTPDGFAYDETTKTYKLFHTWFCDSNLFRTGIEVYDLGTSEWRRGHEEYFPSCIRQKSSQVVSNGALHWDIGESTQSLEISRRCIGAIHIENENFQTFESPFRGVEITKRTLGSLKGRLCVMDLHPTMNRLIIWSMGEYGDGRSWYQEYSIWTKNIWPFSFARSLQTVEDTSILVESFTHRAYFDRAYFDPEKNELQTAIGGIQCSKSGEVFHHVGSLVSPRPKRFETKG